MDQITIGRFIAAERKRKGCTQKQLAEKLNISDKTVSKWECGKGFPEVSLLLPLCKELDITVNELLSGARVTEEEYQKKADDNNAKTLVLLQFAFEGLKESETHEDFKANLKLIKRIVDSY